MSTTVAEPAHFRRVLGNFASGVTVITAVDDGTPFGFTCQAFTSLSLDPPLVSFTVSRGSSTRPHIHAAGRFCVNVLAADQSELCRTFATRGVDRFAGVDWHPSADGSPILHGVLAWIDCRLVAEYPAGDHTIVIGAVTELACPRDADPLLFYQGRLVAPASDTPPL